MSNPVVLVSGVSGFLGTHVAKQLLEAGYRVRGTVRSTKDEKKVGHLRKLCPGAKYDIELVEADLMNAGSWTKAVAGCTYVHHVASPFPGDNPCTEDEVIQPAVDGTLNVLKAVANAKTVKRVVLTSSVVAICAEGGNTKPYTEEDWLDPEISDEPYNKSKVLAEKAAWDFVKALPADQKFELAVVNPGLIFGPALHGSPGTSTNVLWKLLERQVPAIAHFVFPIVDVRDVALAHVKCMTTPGAVGQRHIIVNTNMWFKDVAQILDQEFRSQGYQVPTMEVPAFVVTIASWFDKSFSYQRKFVSKAITFDKSRMKNVLNIAPIDGKKTVIDMAYTMIENGFVKKTPNYRGPPSGLSL